MLKTATIEELTQDGAIRYGVVQPGKHYEGGVPFLKAGDIGNCSVNVTPEFKIAPEISDKYKRSILRGGEILITLVGNPGAVSIAPPDVAGFNVARAVGVLNVNSEVDNRFLCYALQGKSAQDQIHALLNTTVQATLNLSDLKKIEISVPEVASQKAIAHILGTLDDKIELNQKMNQNLEEIAKAIFKSWFVDFDPVRAKAVGRPTGLPPEISGLFPDELMDSEIGEIPRGWDIAPLDQIGNFRNGLAMQKYPAVDGEEQLPVVKIAQLRKGSTDGDDLFASGVPSDFVIADGDYVFSWSGSLMAKYWVGGKGALNQHLFKVEEKTQPLWFIAGWV